MIRNRLYYQFIEILEKNGGFLKTDFQIETLPLSQQGNKVFIIYKHEPKYQFELQIPDSPGEAGEYTFTGKVSPGIVSTVETFLLKGEPNLLSGINTWVNCIWEELATQPFLKSAKSIEENIDSVYTKFSSPTEEYFSAEEVDDLRTHLEKLEKDFQIEIHEEIKDKKEAWQRIGMLSAEMERLKSGIGSVKRPLWLYSFYRSAYNLIG